MPEPASEIPQRVAGCDQRKTAPPSAIRPKPFRTVVLEANDECETIQVLAISGSLRKASFNTALLRAAQELAPEGMSIQIYADFGLYPALR